MGDTKPVVPGAPVNAAKETATLLRKLKGVKDRSSNDARYLRRQLRAFGHKGGLRALDGGK